MAPTKFPTVSPTKAPVEPVTTAKPTQYPLPQLYPEAVLEYCDEDETSLITVLFRITHSMHKSSKFTQAQFNTEYFSTIDFPKHIRETLNDIMGKHKILPDTASIDNNAESWRISYLYSDPSWRRRLQMGMG